MKACIAALALACSALGAQANPTAPVVVSGSASFSTMGSTLTVTNSPGTIINWQGFSIGASERTTFNQAASSTVLNRVTGSSPSAILGMLDSPGRVFLINPNGILFASGAQISVGGLVASSLDIANADFLAGNYRFLSVGSPGSVEVAAGATLDAASGGFLALLAPAVRIDGTLNAPGGSIGVGAGDPIELGFSGDRLATVTAGANLTGTVNFSGTLNASDVIFGVGSVPNSGDSPFAIGRSVLPIGVLPAPSLAPSVSASAGDVRLSDAGAIVRSADPVGAGGAVLSSGGSVSIRPGSTLAPSAAGVGIASTAAASVTINLQKRELAF